MRAVLVQDASILIDLAEANLLEAWFGLGLDLRTTSLVWREISRKNQKLGLKRYVEEGSFRVEPVGAELLTEIVQRQSAVSRRLTIEDVSILLCAKAMSGVLLTGDRRLREQAEADAIETHGLLWIFDLLVARGALLPGVAADRLEMLVASGASRLPAQECDSRIRKWRK